jgi:hypothetical protein
MGLFDQQRIEDPKKWRSHYSFEGALLLGLSWEAPGTLQLVMSVTKGPDHPSMSGLTDAAKSALPKDARLATVRATFSGVRGFRWLGHHAALAQLKEMVGTLGRLDVLEVERKPVWETDWWKTPSPPFEHQGEARERWHATIASNDFAAEWFCDATSLREGG